jgi:hypothetical protein
MRFALINNERIEASPGLKGICPCCAQAVIAKCGIQRIHHWAHVSLQDCDRWWESETEWHRRWKNHFPVEWQETIMRDKQTGEIHIADVRTIHGLVIEFQHSAIDPTELTARQNFYGNMVWIVNGMRSPKAYERFQRNKNLLPTTSDGLFKLSSPEICFPAAWLKGFIPVIFDFRNQESEEDLYCVFATRLPYAMVTRISREVFINSAINGGLLSWFRSTALTITKHEAQVQIQANTIRRIPMQRRYRFRR